MRNLVLGAALGLVVLGFAVRADNPLPIEHANVLPLALNDAFEFRKFDIFRNAVAKPGATPIRTKELMIDFERKRRVWGAINYIDNFNRTGEFFTFMWRAKRSANLVLRLEYRQANTRNFVQAREIAYPNARGSYTSEFAVVGDDYSQDGAILNWRAILIEQGRIVALLQSRSW